MAATSQIAALQPTAAEQAGADSGREAAKLRQILDGARRVFMADGFDGASMNDIAREAGVSKGTLYVYFQSKQALFVALIQEDRKQQAERICGFDETAGDCAAVLRQFGIGLLSKMTEPDSLAHIRTVIAAAGKFPEIGQAFYEAGPAFGIRTLGDYLARQAQAGVLTLADAPSAASDFIQLCQGDLFRRMLFGVIGEASQEEIAAAADEAVAVFMKAFGNAEGA